MDVRFINEQTIMIYFENKISEETYRNVTAMVRWIREKEILEIQDIVPSYRAVLIYFDEQLHTPRRNQPRLKIHAGSVGIANNQTGLYPSDSPGGWQIIGRTPLKVFSSEREPMSMYEAGEWIQFYAIDEQKFIQIERDISDGNFNVDDWVVIENVN